MKHADSGVTKGPADPAVQGRRLRGAPNRRLNVGQFRKLNLSTSKTARFALEL